MIKQMIKIVLKKLKTILRDDKFFYNIFKR